MKIGDLVKNVAEFYSHKGIGIVIGPASFGEVEIYYFKIGKSMSDPNNLIVLASV